MLFAVSTQVFENDVVSQHHLELFKECGFDRIEIFLNKPHFDWSDSVYVNSMQNALKRLGISVCGVHAPWMPTADIASLDSQERENSIRDVKSAADLLHRLGGQVLVIHPGAALKGEDDLAEKMAISRESLMQIAHYCQPKELKVALENPPNYELCGEPEQLLQLYQSLTASAIDACFDTGHANIAGGIDLWRRTRQEKIYVHLHDNDGVHDSHIPAGSGCFEWDVFFQQLKADIFQGIVSLELSPTEDTERVLLASKKWFAEMKEKHDLGCLR
ncbi:sugar phosphate isomerase/epimerase [bacterium]|nr:sugar phosphate isomerase/epimerase [bacterium]